jgi:ubiquinone/menaquinone biosynthesis C-methylase UbiE
MSACGHYYEFYNAEDPNRWGRHEMPEQFDVTKYWLTQTKFIDPTSVVVELGCGVGPLSSIHPRYVGLDFSFAALKKFVTEAIHLQGDMQALPFKDESVDFIFSWVALEHVPHPERVLAELERVLKVDGVALLAPAWNVRPWAAKALPVRSYHELSWRDRIQKATIPIRNTLLWRSLFAFPNRLHREMCAWRH